jgi:hypothetical protein
MCAVPPGISRYSIYEWKGRAPHVSRYETSRDIKGGERLICPDSLKQNCYKG